MLDIAAIARKNRTFERLVAKAPVYFRDFLSDPSWLAMFVCARFVQFRKVHRWFLHHGSSKAEPALTSNYVSVAGGDAEFMSRLKKDGIATGIYLNESALREIQDFAAQNVCFANFDPSKPMFYNKHAAAEQEYKSTILVGHYLTSIQNCQACVEVANDVTLLALAERYLGSKPKLISHRLWWSFHSETVTPSDMSFAAQSYHFDLDDWNQVKFFFYISDVEKADGPHEYIVGSHTRKPMSFQASLFVGRSEEEIIKQYGARSKLEITGPAGSGFAEDSFGFHVGRPVDRGPRLLLEISFGSTGVMKRRPFGTH